MARGVADREKDRPVEELGPGEGVRAPREPVDRVVGVLEQVRAGLAGQAIGHGAMVVADPLRASPTLTIERMGPDRRPYRIGIDANQPNETVRRRTGFATN